MMAFGLSQGCFHFTDHILCERGLSRMDVLENYWFHLMEEDEDFNYK